jgi:PAS domain S-box-containing protein
MSARQHIKLRKELVDALNVSNDLYLVVDENLDIVFANEKACKLLDYAPAQIKNISLYKLLGLKPGDSDIPDLSQVKENNVPIFFHFLISSSGQSTRVRTRVTLLESLGKKTSLWCSSISIDESNQEQLWISEQRYKNFIELLPEMVCEADLDGKITLANKYAYERFQLSPKDLESGITLDQLFIPEDLKRARLNFLQKVRGRDIPPQEYHVRQKDGKIFPVLTYFTIVYKNKKPIGIRGVMIDITARKDHELQLQREKAYMEQLIEGAPEAIVQTDGSTIIRVNNEFTKLFGYSKSEAIGKDIDKLLTREHYYQEAKSITQEIFKGKKVSTESVRFHKDGRPINVSILGNPVILNKQQIGIYGIYRNITLKKKSAKVQKLVFNISTALLTSNSLGELLDIMRKELSAIIDTTNLFIALYNKEDQTLSFPYFIDEKDRFEKVPVKKTLTGYVIKNKLPVILKSADLKKLEKKGEIELVGSPSKVWVGVPLTLGEEVFGVISLQSYENEDLFAEEDLDVIIFISNQISMAISKIKTEEDLRVAKQKAEQAALAKEQFLSTMSHEIRTPLNAIIGMSQLLMENPRKDQIEYLDALKFSGENLMSLINDILDYNKIESDKVILEEVVMNPVELLKEIIQVLKIRAEEKNNKLFLETGTGVPEFLIGDQVRLNQIITNLIGNAIKFTENGTIKIHLSLVSETKDRYLLRFSVEDTGIGIEQENLDYIFESFTQAKSDITRKFGGSGLGLAITKKLIDFQGGEIHVESTPGKGSRFFFELPYKKGEIELPENGDVLVESFESLDNIKILVAEDNEINLLVARKFLENWGVEVTIAENGKVAIEKIKKDKFDLVLMDLQMPEMDGYEATKQIKSLNNGQFKDLPIIALTASILMNNKDRITKAGLDDSLIKPFDAVDLYQVIIRHLKKSYKN